MSFNVYMTGVGGQGIGLLSEVILRTADHAGFCVKAVDTHGLAQRGGIVISHLRMGDHVYSPLIHESEADLVVGLEMHEALRAMNRMSRYGSTLIYYKASLQPLPVRLGEGVTTCANEIKNTAKKLNIRLFPVEKPALQDSRQQNMVILGQIARKKLIPRIETRHFLAAMEDLMDGKMLEENKKIFMG